MKKITITFVALIMLFSIATTPIHALTYQETISSVVLIEIIDSYGDYYYGSGFVISNDAVIVTAAHVIMDYNTDQPADYIDICLIESEYDIPECKYSARVLAYDEDLDLALIYPSYEIDEYGNEIGDYLDIETMQTIGLPYVDMADYLPLLGDEINILGYPGASGLSSITLTKGTVSGFEMLFEDLVWKIMTDATINPGNSGGPAYNDDEKVIGVVTEISLEGIGGNYGYIISNEVILLWFLDLVEQGTLNEEFVNNIFSNDYIEDIQDYDYDEVQIFTDVDFNSKNAEAINFLKNSGVISGYPDGSFKPLNSLNRAELLKILVEGMGYSPDENIYKNCFPDVKADWYAKYVCFAKEQGWVSGYPDSTFKPGNFVNKAEALKMLLETFEIQTSIPKINPYSDVPKEEWYSKYVHTASNIGLLEETGTHYWPGADITRGQISENIYRLVLTVETERIAFVAAMVEASCLTQGFADPESAGTASLMRSAFAMYELESTDKAIVELIEKYENDEDVLGAIGLGVLETCPEYYEE
jgi:V8-like Glu-specific endopeptidase